MFISALLLLPAVLAANTNIMVGDGGQVYSPNMVTAKAGDTLTFSWSGAYHSVSQSSFDSPCTYMDNGINSGIITTTTGPSFVVTVNDTNPIWIYCSEARHCQNGMVMVVNPPSGKTLDDFMSAAATASEGSQPGSVSGGSFGSAGSASSAPATSAASSAAASSAAASSMMSSASSEASAASSMSTMSAGSSSMASGAATTSMASGASATQSGAQSSSVSTTSSKAAGIHHVGDAVAVVGAAALALFL